MRVIAFSVMMLAGVVLCGCMPRTLAPGAENVRLATNSKYISIKCKFLSKIAVDRVHGDLSLSAKEPYRVLDDVNLLKNEGKKAGANVVVLDQHERKSVRGPRTFPRAHIHKDEPNIVTHIRYNIKGRAYHCPAGLKLNEPDLAGKLSHT